MARPHDSEKYDLSDAKTRDLIKLVEKGKPLSEKYRFILFEDKREVELVWSGKSHEVCTAILPFQEPVRHCLRESCGLPPLLTFPSIASDWDSMRASD